MIQAILNDFREYYLKLSDYLFLKRFNFKFKFYSKLCDMSCKASGKKTRLVIVGGDRKMEIWNKATVKNYQRDIKIPTLEIQKDGSSKKVIKKVSGRVPKNWGSLELNEITFYISRPNNDLTAEERKEYRDKFNSYAKRFLR